MAAGLIAHAGSLLVDMKVWLKGRKSSSSILNQVFLGGLQRRDAQVKASAAGRGAVVAEACEGPVGMGELGEV